MTRLDHLADEEILDALSGGEAAAHAATCGVCGARVREVAATLASLADVDVPSPSPAALQEMREGVARRVAAEAMRSRWRQGLGLLGAAAALLLVVLPGPPPVAPEPVLPAWTALPAEDPALDVLAGAQGLGGVSCEDLAGCLAGLSEDEDVALVGLVHEDLEGGSS